MIVYNKLVRDKIPQIIEDKGKHCEVKVLNHNEYLDTLRVKLQEELDEYKTASEEEDVAELADLVEVVYTILKHKGVSIEQFERVRLKKREERGGFDEKLLLVKVWGKEETQNG
ncbi:phosphoribosyl-ATP pyrophosphohydrolase [Brevibacillus reuszeri]|uniref:phosphoribosyl-ATP pyrophosphohydrolase n=1 Tax=Brevibacillus reuszeri TaxID=54915 RepID=UPI003D1E291C